MDRAIVSMMACEGRTERGTDRLTWMVREGTEITSEVTLPVDGDYQIDVYLYRSAARRGAKAPFTITAILNH